MFVFKRILLDFTVFILNQQNPYELNYVPSAWQGNKIYNTSVYYMHILKQKHN